MATDKAVDAERRAILAELFEIQAADALEMKSHYSQLLAPWALSQRVPKDATLRQRISDTYHLWGIFKEVHDQASFFALLARSLTGNFPTEELEQQIQRLELKFELALTYLDNSAWNEERQRLLRAGKDRLAPLEKQRREQARKKKERHAELARIFPTMKRDWSHLEEPRFLDKIAKELRAKGHLMVKEGKSPPVTSHRKTVKADLEELFPGGWR